MYASVKLRKGDYFTVDSWVGGSDRSYTRDVLLVECVDGDLIHCSDVRTRSKSPLILRGSQVNLRVVSKEFAESIISKIG